MTMHAASAPLPPISFPQHGGVPALVLNASFLDVLPQVQPLLDAAGFAILTLPDYLALPVRERHLLLATTQVVFGPGPFTSGDVDHAPNLKVISLAASGHESVDIVAATARGVVVANAPTDLGTASVADLTFGLILDVARQISASDALLKAGVWRRPFGVALSGKTLGIIGFGRIGRAVAARARGFGMTVLTLDHHADNPAARDINVHAVPLSELLARGDVVSLHGRLSPETHHLIGRAELRQMRPSAYLINTARAALIDPAALAEALTDGWIAGAGLDVFAGEPGTDNPVLSFPNVVATPHIGNRTIEGVLDVVACSIRNARAVLDGDRPEFLVNPEVYERGET